MKIGLVTALNDGIAFVWTPGSVMEFIIDQRRKPFHERLKVGNWIDFDNKVSEMILSYTVIPTRLEFKIDEKGRLQVKTKIVFLPKDEGGSSNFITAESCDFGKVGNFHKLTDIVLGQKYYAWVMRVPKSKEHLGEEYGVQWCLAKQPLEPLPSDSLSSSRQGQLSDVNCAEKKGSVEEDTFIKGLVVSFDGNLPFVWNPDLGEGIVSDNGIGKLKIGDWLEFTVAKGKIAQGYSFVVLHFRIIRPLFPAHRFNNTVEVRIPFKMRFGDNLNGGQFVVDFFGKIDDDRNILSDSRAIKNNSTAVIRRRRPNYSGGSIWNLVEIISTSFVDEKLPGWQSSKSSSLFATEALKQMIQSKDVQEAIKQFDPSALRDLTRFYEITL